MSYDKDEYEAKVLGQCMLRVGVILRHLRKYGQDEEVDRAIKRLKPLIEQTHYKLSGIDEPFNIKDTG